MDFEIISIFPDFFTGPLSHGIVFQAQKRGLIQVRIHDLRDFTTDRHKTVDDRPFGGGAGMVLKPEPLFRAIRKFERRRPCRRGKLFCSRPKANGLSNVSLPSFPSSIRRF
jgi:tRNA (guanine37-N1)-methyltransferase